LGGAMYLGAFLNFFSLRTVLIGRFQEVPSGTAMALLGR
jgi:hypothetical protein